MKSKYKILVEGNEGRGYLVDAYGNIALYTLHTLPSALKKAAQEFKTGHWYRVFVVRETDNKNKVIWKAN